MSEKTDLHKSDQLTGLPEKPVSLGHIDNALIQKMAELCNVDPSKIKREPNTIQIGEIPDRIDVGNLTNSVADAGYQHDSEIKLGLVPMKGSRLYGIHGTVKGLDFAMPRHNSSVATKQGRIYQTEELNLLILKAHLPVPVKPVDQHFIESHLSGDQEPWSLTVGKIKRADGITQIVGGNTTLYKFAKENPELFGSPKTGTSANHLMKLENDNTLTILSETLVRE